jgi:ParB/RepB/Spo0J family partition protein
MALSNKDRARVQQSVARHQGESQGLPAWAKDTGATLTGSALLQNLSGLYLADPDDLISDENERKDLSPTDESLNDLCEAIKSEADKKKGIGKTGIHQPIIIFEDLGPDGKTTLLKVKAGHRRTAAAKRLKADGHLRFVPVVLDDASNRRERRITRLQENLQRQEVPPLHLAAALREMHDEDGLTWQDIRAALGLHPDTLKKYANLDSLDEDVKKMVEKRHDTVERAPIINKVPVQYRKEIIDGVLKGDSHKETVEKVEEVKLRIAQEETADNVLHGNFGPKVIPPSVEKKKIADKQKEAASKIAQVQKDWAEGAKTIKGVAAHLEKSGKENNRQLSAVRSNFKSQKKIIERGGELDEDYKKSLFNSGMVMNTQVALLRKAAQEVLEACDALEEVGAAIFYDAQIRKDVA